MTSQGQRFRRRALRRGYKVDEVDSFLDRVEATLAGDPLGAPVTAHEVHDVVFRVRFGGYDEWQVDLHLDRVERQVAELEERGGFNRGPDPRMAAQDRLMPPDRMARPDRLTHLPPRDDRPMPQPRPVSPSPMGASQDPYGRYGSGFDPPEAQGGYDRPPAGYERSSSGFERPAPGFDRQGAPFDQPGGGFDGFEPGRHGKTDMTAEIRMPDRDATLGRGQGPGGPGMGPPPGMMPPGMGAPPPMGNPGAPPMSGVQRVDMLRRTFQPRRFGSGYDPVQVDRLFEAIVNAMAGRGPMPLSEAELETARFGLVPGGYFEAEVDAALKEVRDILRGM